MTVFDRLLSSGLPITWTILLLAWNRLYYVPTPVPEIVTTEQLLAYAMSQIGCGPPEQEVLTAELAFAEDQDTWTVGRCLQALASDSPEDVQYAIRVWRWVLLSEIVTELEQAAQDAPDKNAPTYGVWTDDFRTSVYCDLSDFWGQFGFPSQGFAVAENWAEGDWLRDIPRTLCLIGEHRRWLVQEESVLRDHGRNEGRIC
jgi:hypothetical protein